MAEQVGQGARMEASRVRERSGKKAGREQEDTSKHTKVARMERSTLGWERAKENQGAGRSRARSRIKREGRKRAGSVWVGGVRRA